MSKSLLLACLLLISSDKPDPNLVKLQVRAPKRLNECNVYLDSVRDDHEHGRAVRRAFLQTACGVPEAALRGQWWWGEGPQPPGFSLDVGCTAPRYLMANIPRFVMESPTHLRAGQASARRIRVAGAVLAARCGRHSQAQA